MAGDRRAAHAPGRRTMPGLACLAVMAVLAAYALPSAAASGAQESSGAGVTVLQQDGSRSVPCPEIRKLPRPKYDGELPDLNRPLVSGGCVLKAKGRADFVIATAIEELFFSHCTVSFDMRVDGSGRVKIDEVIILGKQPCNDAEPCFEWNTRPDPWDGQIQTGPNNRLELHVDMCFDTCMGHFEGPFVADLRQVSSDRLRITAPDTAVGLSGWKLDGGWIARSGRPLEIRS